MRDFGVYLYHGFENIVSGGQERVLKFPLHLKKLETSS